VILFLFHYAVPVGVFAFCYGRIFHVIRRQGKIFSGPVARTQDVTTATTSRDQNTGQIQQQVTAAATGAKLSHTELNVIQTMVVVIVCFVICWSVPAFANLLQPVCISLQLQNSDLSPSNHIQQITAKAHQRGIVAIAFCVVLYLVTEVDWYENLLFALC